MGVFLRCGLKLAIQRKSEFIIFRNNVWEGGMVLDLVGSGNFSNFAVRFTKNSLKMDETITNISLPNPAVRNWGFLENWKSTASM